MNLYQPRYACAFCGTAEQEGRPMVRSEVPGRTEVCICAVCVPAAARLLDEHDPEPSPAAPRQPVPAAPSQAPVPDEVVAIAAVAA